ncbi:MAG: hypothetical protein ACI379_16525 [Nocardioides sp.]|uniref:PGAP1-like alpha/beta domain-containing protein n=1 Tax=Nocardioides sp. TaxID=35761 RepID=UPI003F046B59
MTKPVPIDSVSGGSHGVQAGYQQMRALAGTYQDKAWLFTEMAGLGARVMANGDLLESSVLAPLSFAEAEAQVLDATTGVNGLTVRAIGIEADALLVEVTVGAFEMSDALSRQISERLDNLLGKALAASLPGLLLAGGAAYLYLQTRSPEEQAAILAQIGDLVHDHPELAQHLVNAGGGLLDALTPGALGALNPGDGPIGSATTNDAARLLALLFGNRTDAETHRVDDAPASLYTEKRPGTLADLMRGLDSANMLDSNDESMNGAIQIQKITDNGQERYVVYIPGTDDMGPLPAGDETARDMLTNYQLIGGMDNSYANGITQALREAGLSGKDIMMVGHSQGGMVATSLASDPAFRDEFNVRHVVSAGSPTAQVPDLPDSVTGFHLENRGDAVPMLDGEDNPDQPNRVTVKFDGTGSHDIADNHDIKHYVEGAQAADSSDHGSIRDAIRAMEESGFLGTGGQVDEVVTYTVSRP